MKNKTNLQKIKEIAENIGLKYYGEHQESRNSEHCFLDEKSDLMSRVYVCRKTGVIVMIDVKNEEFEHEIHRLC